MFVGTLIVVISTLLLAYWFRYSCLLVMRNCAEETTSEESVRAGELQAKLREASDLDPVQIALDRDYAVLVYLVQHAAGLELQSIEDRLLMLDYKVMRLWYRVARLAAPDQAREALSEMVSVVGILSSRLAQRAASRA